MTLQQLRAFLAIVEFGSFRRAARELGVSQAGLTNSLQALEAGLGVSLLQRSAQGVALTADGKRLHARAQLIDREARRAVDEAQRARGAVGGTLHAGFGPTPTAALLHLVVPDFHARFPMVKLKLMSGFYEQLRPALQQGLIELAVTALPDEGPGPGFESKALFKSDLVVVGRPGHPRAQARSLRELAACEWILLGSPGGPGGTITRFYAEQGLPAPRVAATCESFTQLAALIGGTDWLALLPAVMIERGLLGTQVVPIRLKEHAHGFDNCVVYRTEPPLTPAAAAFAAMCESCARIVARVSAPAT
ncbi:MAG: LysR substrate-binding domain-containing protein [Polaromonas sp.]